MSELDNEWLTLKQAAEYARGNPIVYQWLTLKQAAELVGVTPRTVQNWIKNGKIKGYQVVGRIRVKRSDVDALYQPKSPDSPGDASGNRP